MQLNIEGKEYKFVFGVKFVREMDKEFGIEQNGQKFGLGLSTKLPELMSSNVATLSDVLYCATVTESPRPSRDLIDNYIDTTANIEKLFDDVINELEDSNAGKLAVREMKKNLKKAQKN